MKLVLGKRMPRGGEQPIVVGNGARIRTNADWIFCGNDKVGRGSRGRFPTYWMNGGVNN
ncbi:MAG: hypothetical protein JRN37_03000 [Nitrososphaerota archaeon]|nr:hypothetical protein [Nitrososphaerota archaeon]MDG7038118.1 hypothetical protein [Nitrososphaerota archaeon]